MYIPGVDSQLAITELIEIQPENLPTGNLPNVTKEISDVLKLCDTAGLDPHGVGCGMSVWLLIVFFTNVDCLSVDLGVRAVVCSYCSSYPRYYM